MSGAHTHALYVHGHSPVHRLAPECKLAAQLLFVIAVVATPREALWAFAIYAAIVVAMIVLAELPPGFVLRRLAFEVPFVLFAVLLPFIGRGEQVEVLGVSLSIEGLWGAWNILAKATIGLATGILVAATTTLPEFLHGLEHLRFPRAFTQIASFMVRYADVIADEAARMRVARQSRGYEARWIWQARAIASSAGALFVRSYERGERVYLAMVSRGYSGTFPNAGGASATIRDWVGSLVVPVAAACVAAAAWLVRL